MGNTSGVLISKLEIVIPQSLYKLPITFFNASSKNLMEHQDKYIDATVDNILIF